MSPVPNVSESAGRGAGAASAVADSMVRIHYMEVGATLAPLDLDPQTGMVMTRI
jgi:hypothetical protein